MKDKKYCVVVPSYKTYDKLDENELICLDSIYRNYPKELIYFIIPESLDMTGYDYIDEEHIFRNDDRYFKDTRTYSELCLSSFFYEHFIDYEFMFIHQLDAYTIKNNIDYFIDLGYDYYGAPWSKNAHFVMRRHYFEDICGNGGYCLRRIDKMIDFCKRQLSWNGKTPEDLFICLNCRKANILKICPVNIGWEFSFETYFPKNPESNLPMGCHKLWNYNLDLWNYIIGITLLEKKTMKTKIQDLKNDIKEGNVIRVPVGKGFIWKRVK